MLFSSQLQLQQSRIQNTCHQKRIVYINIIETSHLNTIHNNMEAIYKGIKVNEKYAEAERYVKRIEGVARTTNWFETKVKYEKAKDIIQKRKEIEKELLLGEMELKKRRRTKLEELYSEDSARYEAELKKLGLAIYKTKI